MSLGLQEGRERHRRQRRLKSLLVVAALIGIGFFAYATGAKIAERELARLNDEIVRRDAALAESEAAKQHLRAALAAAERRAAQWQPLVPANHEVEPPQARPADRIEARIEPAIRTALPTPDCTAKPTTKRFLVQTPLSTGAHSAVGFAKRAITVTAQGQSATDARGNPEAWFDPDKPVTVNLTQIGGESAKLQGVLPLEHALAVGGIQHRFSVAKGSNRGFAYVTWNRCAEP